MAEGIFVSYRRDDTRHVAGRLAGDLADRFGADSIFRDVESIDGGEEFPAKLEKALGQCAMMLVLIGPKWLDIADAQGRRRLDNPDDWVRQEIAAALRRGIRVVPVLVDDAPLPAEAALPEDLRPLVKRQTRLLSDNRWRGDLLTLVEMLAKVPGLKLRDDPAQPPGAAPAPVAAAPASRFKLIGGGALAAVALIVLVSMFSSDGPDLSGSWRSDSDESYFFTQSGRELTISVKAHDAEIGDGSGRFEDGKLMLRFTTRQVDKEPVTENCDLRAAEENKRFEGECTGPEGKSYSWYIRR